MLLTSVVYTQSMANRIRTKNFFFVGLQLVVEIILD